MNLFKSKNISTVGKWAPKGSPHATGPLFRLITGMGTGMPRSRPLCLTDPNAPANPAARDPDSLPE